MNLRISGAVAALLLASGGLFAQLTFDPANPPTSASPPTEIYNEYTGTFSHQKGPKTVLVFLVKPSDGAAWSSPPSLATLEAQLNTASVNYYNNYSHRQAWFGPKRRGGMDIPRLVVTPVLNLPGTTQTYLNGFGQLQSDCLAAVRALGGVWAAGQVNDYDNFDRWVVMSNTKLISSTGLAYVGGRFAWTGGSLSGGVAEHEWGHNWGVYHANAWNVAAGAPARSPSGSSEEYGDGWDLMGGNVLEAGFNVLFRESLGFLERSRGEVVDVTASGTYRLYDYIHPDRRQAGALARGLLIPMASLTDNKRILLGFGHTTARTDFRTVWNRNAVTMHTILGASGSSRIDTTPGSRQTGDADDSAIKIGRTYSEGVAVNGTQMYGGFHITPVARGTDTVNGQTHEWIDVVVNYQNSIANNQLPVASFAQAQYAVAAGAPLTLSVAASDTNGDALAYDWDFGDGTLSTANSASQTKTWSAAGLYLVSCTVSDMKGGVVTARTWVNVGAQTARTADTPAATFGGIDYEVFLGSWTTLPNFNQLLRASAGTMSTIAIPPGVPANNFAVRYTGYLNIPASDVYQFSLTSEDGSRLRIGGVTVVENDGQRPVALTATGNAYLSAGLHAFTLEYFSRDGTPVIDLKRRTAANPPSSLVDADFRRIDWAANAAPVVSILNPAEGTELIVGASVLLQASASDTDGIAKVQYYAGGAYLGESTAAPYEVTWSNLSPGTKQVQAYAFDSTGRTTLSATRTFTVVSPPPRNLISINFAGDSSASVIGAGIMNVDDIAGAVYQSAYWTTLRATAGFGTPFTFQQMNGTTTGLRDQTGTATSASITTAFTASNILGNTSPANSGNSRLMRSYAWKRNVGDPGTITVSNLPYATYDVYVYFDALNTDANDIVPSAYTLNGVTKYGQNAASLVAGKGDFPNYATWTDYKEATATSATAPIAERLGNYVVFRNQTGPAFTLTVGASDPVNGIQIVESGDSGGVPAVRLLQSGGASIAEGGGPVAYLAWLAASPEADVTLTLNPGAQLSANKASITFTPTNWQTPQVVLATAIDDTAPEGAHSGTVTHSVSATGNYASVTAPALSYTIADNDVPVVGVNVVRHAAEHSAVPRTGLVRFTRSNLGSYAAPLTVNFTATGTAGLTGDYALSGASVSFNTGTGGGSVVIPAGQAQVVLTLTPASDAVAEAQESAVFTLEANSSYTVGSAAATTVSISDDDAADYLTEVFSNNLGTNLFDLNNLSVTFTPSGGSYTAQTTRVSAFPSGTTGFTDYSEAAMGYGTSDNGGWTQALLPSFTYFGVSYNSVKVATNGYVYFASSTYSGNDLNGSAEAHFVAGFPRIAGLGLDLNPGTGGVIQYRRITTVGQQRHVFYYNAVRFSNGTNTASFQIELFDDGRIRITHIGSTLINPSVVGLSTGVANTMPSYPFETTSSPRPFFPSDLSLYGDGTVANVAPTFASVPITLGAAGQSFHYTVVAADENNDPLTLSAPVKPVWLTLTDLGNGTATLTGTPPASGSFAVTLRASDGTTSADQSFTLVTLPVGGNTTPVFTSTPGMLASSGVAYTYNVTATDADGHALTIDAPVKPSWLTITATGNGTATLAGTPPSGIPAPSITLSASDGFATTLQTYSLVVNVAPVVAITRPGEQVITLADLSADLHVAGTMTDDGQPASLVTTWSMVSGPGAAVFSSPAAINTRVSFPVAGRYVLRLTANDGAASVSDEIQVYAGGADPDAVRTNGLAGYWKFNEGAGTTSADSSGNSRTATLAGASTWNASGYSGAALTQSTPATTAFASYSYGSAHPAAFTIATWMRIDEMPANAVRYLYDTVNGTTQHITVYINTGVRRISVQSRRSTTNGVWFSETPLPSNTWTHVAVSYDASNVANDPVIYINGVATPVVRGTAPVGTATAQSTGRIGVNWRGSIDEFRLYNRIVPAAEIATLSVPDAFNAAPAISAGPDKDAAAGGTVTLDGTATDDGLPASPGALALTWVIDSGPAGGTFGNPTAASTSFATGGAGDYVLRFTADDGSIRVSRTTGVTVTSSASAYDTWKTLHFPGQESNPSVGGDAADPDADGLPNLVEYALGGDPAIAEQGVMPMLSTDGTSLILRFDRPKGLAGIVYAVESSTGLVSWSTSGVAVDVIEDHGTTETVEASVPLSGQRQFLRLKVSLPP